MNRDKDEFWAITDPDGNLHCGTYLTRVEAIASHTHGWVVVKGRTALVWKAQKEWQQLYRQGYRARRVRVEVI